MSKIIKQSSFGNTLLLTHHFHIMENGEVGCIFEILMPDGRYIYKEFSPNHEVIESITWHMCPE